MRTLLEQGLGWVVLGGLVWWWLGVPESSALTTLLSVALVIAIVVAFAGLVWRGIGQLSARRPVAWLLGIPVAYLLVKWVPGVESLTMQMVSMAVRFAAAYLLFVLAWVTLLSVVATSLGKPRSSQPSTVAAP